MVDTTGLVDRIAEALAPVALPTQVKISAPIIEVDPVVSSSEAEAAITAANRMIGDVVIEDAAGRWTVPASQVATWISFAVTGEGGYRPVADPDNLEGQLAQMAKAIARPASNASYLFDKNGKIVGAKEGTDGRALDRDGTVAAITSFLDSRAASSEIGSVAPAVILTRPEVTTAEAAATAPLMTKISEWTTYFPIYVNNGFGANIWIPAMDIDGYVLPAGAWFDFWKAIGPVTRERGYKDGGAIINGKTEPQGALAGGICSTSTTLFNAALRAGLQMGARRNHYYYISRYPLGLDATVFQSSSGSVQTMSFRNDTDYPILIRAYKIRKGSSGYVKFELYGVPNGRQVEIGKAVVKNVRPARETTEYTDTLPAGTRKRVEYPADGQDVWATVTVKDADGTVRSKTTYYSHYARVDGVTQVGTGT
jgi:vancomycin resistance protein YoaR